MSDSSIAPSDENRKSYQRLLRALGFYLDGEEPRRFTVTELQDRFTVVLERVDGALASEQHTFQSLDEEAEQLVERRKRRGTPRTITWPLAGTTREDFLRALGFELDDEQARNILLDELDDGLLLTYSYLDPSKGYVWQKRLLVLREPEIKEILRTALSRRALNKRPLRLFRS